MLGKEILIDIYIPERGGMLSLYGYITVLAYQRTRLVEVYKHHGWGKP